MDTQHKIYEIACDESDKTSAHEARPVMMDKMVTINLPISQFAILSRKAAALGISVEDMVAQNISILLSDK